MIKTVNDLLTAIKAKGVEEIEQFYNIKHGPTIGAMYEGLSKKIVSKALFESADIHVASGFISNSDGDMTKQIDCMIVIGEGKQIPNTFDYVYDINNVIMVIEVKKNLHSKELSEGYDNLRSVCKVTKPDHSLKLNMIEDAFEAMTGKKTPKYEDVEKLPVKDQMIFHSLVTEAMLPIRVIFGFDGFKSEIILRQKFKEYLNENCIENDVDLTLEEAEERLNSGEYNSENKSEEKYGFGVVSLPNLIVAGENSIVKTNGMPYALICNEKGIICWMASYRRNPLLIFLELLWTRLTYYYNLPSDVFGTCMQQEGLAPFLFATGTKNGWIYQFYKLDEKGIDFYNQDKPWEPIILSQNEFILMNLLCRGQSISVDDLNRIVKEQSEQIINNLNMKRLIYVDEDGILRLLTKQCKCVIVPNYGYVAADDKDGRLTSWVLNKMKESRDKNQGDR